MKQGPNVLNSVLSLTFRDLDEGLLIESHRRCAAVKEKPP
jgi:hypothetical protein